MVIQDYEVQYRTAYDEKLYTDHDGNTIVAPAAEDLSLLMRQGRADRRQLFFVGNGGSAGIAVHMTADFLKNGRMRTIDLYAPATLTCLGNDYGYEYVFSKQLELLADPGDVLVAISSSGNSPNILRAAETMRVAGGKIITFTGFKEDNLLRAMGERNLYVPSMAYGIVESIHNQILQQVVDEIMVLDAQEG
ncbi:SIS domain-containing protein [Selenomonas artemidis]|jgi:possible sugar isomerase (SIS)|uniref:SIS domain-containing protein n=1 Tax=Selenomonas artemidis TaxID=671224 RepID=UPI0023F4D851|nr:SIS domain-containing protein [Selenomonas artemidis]